MKHKFGTWYPIEELKQADTNVLFYTTKKYDPIVIGSVDEDGVLWNELGTELLSFDLGYSNRATKWMPLPPPPGEKNEGIKNSSN